MPVARNRYEAEWMRVAARHRAGRGARHARRGPRRRRASRWPGCRRSAIPVWKALLRDGAHRSRHRRARSATCWAASTPPRPTDPTSRARFPTDAIFYAIRLEPYLVADRRARTPTSPIASPRWSRRPQAHKRVLVHGDFSPKNMLIGPAGPGDPRCRMRVVRRSRVRPRVRAEPPAAQGRVAAAVARALRRRVRPRCATRYSRARRAGSLADALDARVAALLPALMLARIDGKSPVEYLTDDARATRSARSRARMLSHAGRAPLASAIAAIAIAPMTPTHDQSRARAPRLGFARAARPSRPRSCWRAASSAARIAPAGASRGSREAVDLRDGGTRFGGFDVAQRDRQRARSDRARALRHGRARPGGRRRGADRARRHAEQGAARRQRDGRGVARRRACRAPRRTACRCGATSPATSRCHAAAARGPDLRRRRARGPAHRHPGPDGDADRRVERSPTRSTMVAEVYRAAGELMQRRRQARRRRRRRRLVAAVRRRTRRRCELIVRAIERAGYRPGRATPRSRSTSPRPSSAATAVTGSALEQRELDRDGDGGDAARLDRALSDRLDRGSVRRGRPRRRGSLHARRRRSRADHRRRLPDDQRAARRTTRRPTQRVQRGADQAQPGRHADRGARRARRRHGARASARSSRRARARPRTSSIAHLAVGWNAGQLKVGSFARGERMAKWNEVLRIEEASARACRRGRVTAQLAMSFSQRRPHR